MELENTIKVSDPVKEQLEAFKKKNQHTSYDSALRDLLSRNQDRTNARVIDPDNE